MNGTNGKKISGSAHAKGFVPSRKTLTVKLFVSDLSANKHSLCVMKLSAERFECCLGHHKKRLPIHYRRLTVRQTLNQHSCRSPTTKSLSPQPFPQKDNVCQTINLPSHPTKSTKHAHCSKSKHSSVTFKNYTPPHFTPSPPAFPPAIPSPPHFTPSPFVRLPPSSDQIKLSGGDGSCGCGCVIVVDCC